jgi:hypothetical protein
MEHREQASNIRLERISGKDCRQASDLLALHDVKDMALLVGYSPMSTASIV